MKTKKQIQKPIIITNENPQEIEVKTTYDDRAEVIRIKMKLKQKING